MMPHNCKQARSEPYMSPNNYDIEFDANQIPSNVQIESGTNLEKRLQKLMPHGKIVHVSVASTSTPQNNMISITPMMNIRKLNEDLITRVDFK